MYTLIVSGQGLSVAEMWLGFLQSIRKPVDRLGPNIMKIITSVISTQIHDTEKAFRLFATSDGLWVRPFQAVKFRSRSSGNILGTRRGGKSFLPASHIPRSIKKIPAPPSDPIKNCENTNASLSKSSPKESGSAALSSVQKRTQANKTSDSPAMTNRKGDILLSLWSL